MQKNKQKKTIIYYEKTITEIFFTIIIYGAK